MPLTHRLLMHYGRWLPLLVLAGWGLAVAALFQGRIRFAGIWLFYGFVSVVGCALVAQRVRALRERFIREAPLPRFLRGKLMAKYPHLTVRDCELVERGLRQFFLAGLRARKQFVAMPSQAVDVLWHEFILHTQGYQRWCRNALGFFLHHTPAEAMGQRTPTNDGLRRTWFWACKEESIAPRKPSRLPLLFALDAKLAIHDGFFYQADCRGIHRTAGDHGTGATSTPYCGTDFSSDSYSGSAGNFGGTDSSNAGSDSGGGSDGGGDGGSSCGGSGCGGGGD